MGEHDVLWEIGNGPEGAVAFAKQLQASNFQFTMMDGGPPPPVTACSEQRVSLLLTQSGGRQAYEATFQFKDGQLVEAWAHDINVYAGKIDAK